MQSKNNQIQSDDLPVKNDTPLSSGSGLERTNRERKSFEVNNISTGIPSIPLPLDYGVDAEKYSFSFGPYLPNIGKNDNLPNLLFEARHCSVTHDACIKNIVDATIGKGLHIKDIPHDSLKKENKEFYNFLRSCNNDNDTFDTLCNDALDAYKQDGIVFVEVVIVKVGNTTSVKAYVKNNLYCRFGPLHKKDGRPFELYYSKTFAKKTSGLKHHIKDVCKIRIYDQNRPANLRWTEDGKTKRTILYFRNKVNGIDQYGLPDSFSSLKHQIIEAKAPQYNIDMFENNMVLSSAIVFKSSMTPEEARAQARSIITSHTGDGKQGRIAVISSEAGIDEFEHIKYDTQKEGSFEKLEATAESKIIQSHGWAKEFTGSSDKGGLNKGGSYLRALWDSKETSVLKPLRKLLIEKFVQPFMKIYSECIGDKSVVDYEFQFIGEMPFSYLGELKAETFIKKKEAREMAGLDPEEDEVKANEYLSESSSGQRNFQNPKEEEDKDV